MNFFLWRKTEHPQLVSGKLWPRCLWKYFSMIYKAASQFFNSSKTSKTKGMLVLFLELADLWLHSICHFNVPCFTGVAPFDRFFGMHATSFESKSFNKCVIVGLVRSASMIIWWMNVLGRMIFAHFVLHVTLLDPFPGEWPRNTWRW